MIRKSSHPDKRIIKWRSHEPNRLETFSDAVFAFAITLVIVSLEVPKSFGELRMMMTGLVSFGICFGILFWIWNIQNTFFRRFGLKDMYTTLLNAVLLFTVLSYVYPLKFLFNLLFHIGVTTITPAQIPSLMFIYDCGYCLIFLLFFLMYSHAHRQAEQIGLSGREKFETNTIRFSYLLNAMIAVVAVTGAYLLPLRLSGLSGFLYFLIWPVMTIWFSMRGRKTRQLFRAESAVEPD